MYTLHMLTRYADLPGKIDEILKENFEKSFLEGLCYLKFSWYFAFGGVEGVKYPVTPLIIQCFNYSVREINSLCKRYKKKNIFDYSFNMEVINDILIQMNIILMTSDVFLHWKKQFQIISNGNFLYFYFCKGWHACRSFYNFFQFFFYITKGTLIFTFAWHLVSAWAWLSISVYISFACKV